MNLEKAYITMTEICECKTNIVTNTDGYAVRARIRCLDCFDTGKIVTKLTLIELKSLLATIS